MSNLWQTHLGDSVAYDPRYHDNARVEIASFVSEPPGLVLDVGCAGGATGRLLKEKFPGTRVIGVESHPQAAAQARQFLDDVIDEPIATAPVRERLRGEPVALVLLLDILEHLADPWRGLVQVRSWLAAGTRVLASVPNVRNIVTLDDLAAGRWEYGPNGVLDITHLRFFTRASLRELFEQTGYDVLDMVPIFRPETVEHYIVDRRPGRLTTRNLSIAFRDRDDLEDLFAFQYVVEARTRELPARAGDSASAGATRS
ncbi:MAG TPA: class I SAM-dependent methyltransferase [Casimicrobiaceae bacterium]|nr:class I SAM-dependent methyltransferase [Casimicrobiaceae bacterium]